MRKIAILQSNYLPWRGYFKIIKEADIFCFYDTAKYTKNDWRNRNIIMGQNGPFWITIPFPKDSVQKKINEVKFQDNSWRKKHMKSILQSYGKSKYFDALEKIVYPIIADENILSLSELNSLLIQNICSYIGINTKIISDDKVDYKFDECRVQRLVNLIISLNGTHYLSGINAKNYIEPKKNLFLQKNIELTYLDHKNYSSYNTKFEYNERVSIIDMIANVEKEEIYDLI